MQQIRFLGMAVSAWLAFTGLASAADLGEQMAIKSPVVAAGPGAVFFGGGSVSPHSWFADVGGVWAFNRNLNTDGPLFRLHGGMGRYQYLMLPGVEVSVDHYSASAMVGYQRILGNGAKITGYVGAQVQEHDNNLDPAARVRGTKWGVIGQGEIYVPYGDRAYGLLIGQISSVHTSYFAMAKYGVRLSPSLSVGPEVVALGNERFDAQRAGLFASLDLTPNAQFVVSGGYNWQDGTFRNNDGAYGTVHLRFLH